MVHAAITDVAWFKRLLVAASYTAWLAIDSIDDDDSGMSMLQVIQRLHCNTVWRTILIVIEYSIVSICYTSSVFWHYQFCKIKLLVKLVRPNAGE